MRRTYVLAGNIREYDYFRRKHECSLMDIRYISDVGILYDTEALIIVKVGSWVHRKDYAEILDRAISHNATILDEGGFAAYLEKEKEMERTNEEERNRFKTVKELCDRIDKRNPPFDAELIANILFPPTPKLDTQSSENFYYI